MIADQERWDVELVFCRFFDDNHAARPDERLAGVRGRKSEDNPFVGTKGVPLCFTAMPECAQASKLRIGAK